MSDYENGYMKPPRDKQFQPGQSGNSKGRPRGSKNTYKLLDDILNEKVQITKDSHPIKINKKTAILLQAANKATKGDLKALQILLPHMLVADIIEVFIKEICVRNGYEYIAQATARSIMDKWGKKITVNESSKIIDFAINTQNKLFLIETNFYGGGGSKLKSTAGEYIEAFNQWSGDGHQFIWITDGFGWKTTQRPLRDTFNVTDYILNIDMVQKGILENLII